MAFRILDEEKAAPQATGSLSREEFCGWWKGIMETGSVGGMLAPPVQLTASTSDPSSTSKQKGRTVNEE
jgi:hypothetical protein